MHDREKDGTIERIERAKKWEEAKQWRLYYEAIGWEFIEFGGNGKEGYTIRVKKLNKNDN